MKQAELTRGVPLAGLAVEDTVPLNQHDPWRASALARRIGGDDNRFLRALQPLDLLFELSDVR
jgi:hypothetical protein